MSKPINVLTGIDYWLDNLICNVPELAMCYHDNGIVQVCCHFYHNDLQKLTPKTDGYCCSQVHSVIMDG
jgi:hypothetical protein